MQQRMNYIPSNKAFMMDCGFILSSLQLLPMVGVSLGEEPSSLVGRLQHSAPAVKQINKEFQDAVSLSLHNILYTWYIWRWL